VAALAAAKQAAPGTTVVLLDGTYYIRDALNSPFRIAVESISIIAGL
jgi:hypothetical protein